MIIAIDTYRGYTLQTLDTYKVHILNPHEDEVGPICTEESMVKARKVIDEWIANRRDS